MKLLRRHDERLRSLVLIQDLVDWFNTYLGGSVPDNLINKE